MFGGLLILFIIFKMGNSVTWEIIIPIEFINLSPLKKEIKVITAKTTTIVTLKSSSQNFKKVYDKINLNEPFLAELEYDFNDGTVILQDLQSPPHYFVEGKIHYILDAEKESVGSKYQIILHKNYKSNAPKTTKAFYSQSSLDFEYGLTYEFEFKIKNIFDLELVDFKPLFKHTINHQEQKEYDTSGSEIN